jgi:hypothetical protein
MYRTLIFLFLCCFCAASFAQDKYLLNFGTYTEFYNAVQMDPSGGLRTFDPAPTVGFGLEKKFENGFIFLPEVNWVLPRKSGDSIYKNIFIGRADFSYDMIDWLRMRLGSSIVWLNQHGTGGKENINNGNGTSTFYYPSENRSSFNNTLDLGAEVLFSSLAFRLQTYIFSALKEDRRQISYSLFVTYYWDR